MYVCVARVALRSLIGDVVVIHGKRLAVDNVYIVHKFVANATIIHYGVVQLCRDKRHSG